MSPVHWWVILAVVAVKNRGNAEKAYRAGIANLPAIGVSITDLVPAWLFSKRLLSASLLDLTSQDLSAKVIVLME